MTDIRVTADDIPISVTKLVYTCPLSISKAVSQNQVAELLAHYWPAIQEHFATLIETQNPDRDADFSAGVDWAADTIRNAG
jgi:hypothetical protein